MRIFCPFCSSEHTVDSNQIPLVGMDFSCPNCQNSFRVGANGQVEAREATDGVAPSEPLFAPASSGDDVFDAQFGFDAPAAPVTEEERQAASLSAPRFPVDDEATEVVSDTSDFVSGVAHEPAPFVQPTAAPERPAEPTEAHGGSYHRSQSNLSSAADVVWREGEGPPDASTPRGEGVANATWPPAAESLLGQPDAATAGQEPPPSQGFFADGTIGNAETMVGNLGMTRPPFDQAPPPTANSQTQVGAPQANPPGGSPSASPLHDNVYGGNERPSPDVPELGVSFDLPNPPSEAPPAAPPEPSNAESPKSTASPADDWSFPDLDFDADPFGSPPIDPTPPHKSPGPPANDIPPAPPEDEIFDLGMLDEVIPETAPPEDQKIAEPTAEGREPSGLFDLDFEIGDAQGPSQNAANPPPEKPEPATAPPGGAVEGRTADEMDFSALLREEVGDDDYLRETERMPPGSVDGGKDIGDDIGEEMGLEELTLEDGGVYETDVPLRLDDDQADIVAGRSIPHDSEFEPARVPAPRERRRARPKRRGGTGKLVVALVLILVALGVATWQLDDVEPFKTVHNVALGLLGAETPPPPVSKRAADKKRQAETAEPAEEKKPVDGALENAKAALKAGDAATARVALAARAPKPDDGYEVPYLAGRAELLDGNHEKALPLFERALTLDPSQSEVRYLLGECHWELGHVDQAKEAFDAVVRQRPDDSRARLSLAKIEFAQGNTTQALELTQAVVKDQEGLEKPSVSLLFEAHYLLSRIHAVQDNLEAQRRHLTEALDLRECHEEALLALSRYLSDRKQFEEAKKRLLKCSDKCESVAFYRDLALIHLELSELSEAASVVDKGLAAHEDDINLLLLSGRTRARLNEVETSKKAFERVIEKAERQQEAYLELSALLVDSGRSAEAVELLNSGVEKMTNPGPLLERLADVYSHLRDAEETRKTLARLVDIQPMNFKARLKLAEQLKASGFVKEAILHYEFLYKHDNLQRNVRRSYADALLEAGRFEEAERELTLLVQQDPNDLRAKTLLGAVLVEAGREDEAEKHLHEVVKKDVHDSRAQYYLARMMMNHERHKKALAYFGRSLAGKDPRLEYRFQYGKALLTIGGHKHYSEAVDAFSGIISRYEKGDATNRVLKRICDVYLNRGRAFMKLRLFKKALADFEKAMDLDRTRADTVTAFASSLLRQSRYREAERFLLEVIEEDPTYPDAHFHLGELYVQREQFNDARRQFHLVIKESELSFPTAYRHLGYIYRTKGMDRDALKYFKKYLSLAGEDAPDRRDIRRMLRLD